MPSIIYNDDVEMNSPSMYDGPNETSSISDESTPGTYPVINPYPVTDNTQRTDDGWPEDHTAYGGNGGMVYPNIPPTEKDPLKYSTKIIKEKTRIILHEYSTEYLQNLHNQNAKFYAVYTDGTEDEVDYTEVYNPYQISEDIYVNEAMEIANAINQHFWDDTNGIHVTDETKEDWTDAVSDSFSDLSNNKPYHNILINSLGMLLRSALNNLVSLSRSGMTIFDGQGNSIEDILASFTSAGAAFREDGKTRATVTTQGLTVYDNSGSISNGSETYGDQVAFIGIDSSGKPYSRIGKSTKGFVEIGVNSSDNGYIDFYNNDTMLAHIGYDAGANFSGGISNAPYYNFGVRKNNTTIGNYSCIEGYLSAASGYCSHAEAYATTASGACSHAEGYSTTASGYCSHAEGTNSTASSSQSHAEGDHTTASGDASHAEGYYTTASGNYSHAEGDHTKASGNYSHAEGYYTEAASPYSHASGYRTITSDNYEFVCGYCNKDVPGTRFVVGNGTATNHRKNAFTVFSDGTAYITGSESSNGTKVTSDARVKTLIDNLDSETSIKFIKQLQPKHYYKEDVEEYGFYAQEVEEIPEFGNVLVTKDNTGIYDLPDYRLLNYQGLLAPIVSVEQNLIERIEQLEQENAELKQHNKDLNDRLTRIEQMLKI